MKVLYTTPILEHPPAGGPQLRVENSIKALADVCALDIISRSPPALTGGAAAETFYRGFCREFHVTPFARALSANRYLRKAQNVTGDVTGRRAAREADFILDHVNRRGIDIVWFGFGNISFPLIRRIRQLRPDLKLVCDTDSVWSRFVLRELPYVHGPRRAWIRWSGRRKEAEERAWVDLCDVTTAVSEVDAAYYRALAKDPARVRLFSNVIDPADYADRPPPPPGLGRPSLYLAGTFGRRHSPMDTAARWVIDAILPLVRQAEPAVHFYLVGTGSDRTFSHLADPGITVTGKLPSVLPYLCHCDVALVPLKFESGTRFKILEAGMCGTPLVSTALGAEGLPVKDGEHLLIADDAASFADAIVRLLRDHALAERLANNCRAMVYADYGIDALRKEARAILESLRG